MLGIVAPVFLVILVGYIFGLKNNFSAESEKLINVYVLFIALPALLFLAVAKADPADLTQWKFVCATLVGITIAYIAGVGFAYFKGVPTPQSSLVGMASCYGTTGYMGIPIAIAAFGSQAAVPAAIATILHNIPAIMSVIVTHDIAQQKHTQKQVGVLSSVRLALLTTLKNPLTLAVMAGMVFSILRLPLPNVLASFAEFLAAAAGPTALFALGLGLSRIRVSKQKLAQKTTLIVPVVFFKIALQPIVTWLFLMLVGNDIDIWFATAVVMAAQPIGAGAYVFASKHEYFVEESSMAIILSLLPTLLSITLILHFFKI